jgi:hypothetical protein
MVNESMLWHSQVKEEEKGLDNEMAHLFCLSSSLLDMYLSC